MSTYTNTVSLKTNSSAYIHLFGDASAKVLVQITLNEETFLAYPDYDQSSSKLEFIPYTENTAPNTFLGLTMEETGSDENTVSVLITLETMSDDNTDIALSIDSDLTKAIWNTTLPTTSDDGGGTR